MHDQLAELDEGSPGPSSRRSPSPVAEQAPSSWLQRTRQCVERSLRLVIRDPQPVCVLAVQRYLGEIGRCRYHYDVTVYDGVVHDTWLLSPELRHLVHNKRLRCGSRVTISRCSYRYAEKTLCGGLLCIEDMETGDHMDEDCLPAWGILPLCGGRKHYLPLWNNDDPYGEMWDRDKEATRTCVDVSKIWSLEKLEASWNSKKPLPPLLVRVMHKSRLRYFGKADKKIEYPYQAYFEVADYSGMMSMVMWNYLCPEWYNTLQIGNVVLLQQYALKKSYPNRTIPTTGNTQVKRLPNLEISLNAKDPIAKISVLRKEDVKPEWRLPDVKYQFITRSELNNLPHNQVCDVIGLVTYVGRCERKRIRDESEDFWLYRWVHVIDGTSDQPLILEIFATSQPNIFENIHPMTYLVCTQMRVVHKDQEDTLYQAYLTTSNESQVFISKYHKGQTYTSDEKVKDFIKWMRTQHEADVKKKITIGGYHPYPQTPETFAKYCSCHKVEKMLSTIDELKTLIDQLHYREQRRVAIQGIIAACRFVEDEELEDSEVQSREELTSFVSVAPHGNAEMDAVEQTPSDSQNKHQIDASTSNSNAKVVLHPEASNVTVVKRRKKHALEDLSGIVSESSYNVQYSTADVDTNIHKPLTSEDEETPSSIVESETCSGRSWESALWSEVNHHLTDHLHYCTVFPESLPRKFDYHHREFLMQQFNLHPAKLVKSMCTSQLKIQNFASACGLGHYEVTILGINHDLAIDVSLPVLKNFKLFGSNYLPNHIQCLDLDWDAKILALHWLSLKGELVKYSSSRDRLHTVCILDICHLGESKVEIFLNRVYDPIRGELQ
ncbi:RPA-related protein RADX isoform 2-T2 [Mantella aurantiaca]